MNLDDFQNKVYGTAVRNGFWEDDGCPEPSKKAEKLALMHSELSEALEGVRKPHADKYCPQFSNEAVELADCFIRMLDYCKRYNIPLFEAAEAKAAFNDTRPYKHGKTL